MTKYGSSHEKTCLCRLPTTKSGQRSRIRAFCYSLSRCHICLRFESHKSEDKFILAYYENNKSILFRIEIPVGPLCQSPIYGTLGTSGLLTALVCRLSCLYHLDRVKRIWYLSPIRAAKVQASLRIRAVSPEPSLLAHTSSESKGTFKQKARSLAPLNGWACAVEICHDGMLEDTNSLDGAHLNTPNNIT